MNPDENNRIKSPALEQKARSGIGQYGMLRKSGCSRWCFGRRGFYGACCIFCVPCVKKSGLCVYAAHINHGIRGEEAVRDENYVRQWCEQNGVELFVLHADVKAQAAERGETVEEAGRRVSYGFFEQKAEKLGAAIATAHTLSDSIETQILNLARGTGLRGLCGIPPVRDNIIRPLIRCLRSETEEYCQYYGIEYVNDSTNFSHDYTRNRIRLDIVPKLYEINSAFDRAEARLFTFLDEDESCLEAQANERLAEALVSPGVYSLSKLTEDCPAALLRRCAANAASQFTGIAQEARHIKTIEDIASNGFGKAEIKGGCFVSAKNRMLIFTRQTEKMYENIGFYFPFKAGIYKNRIFELKISHQFQINQKNFKNFNKQYFKDAIDCDKISDNAMIRARIQGDKFSPAGRNVTKTLKKLFNEAKISIAERSICTGRGRSEGVFWVGGFGAGGAV